MAEAVKRDNNLTSLHLTIQRARSRKRVRLEAQQGGETFNQWEIDADELGLPRKITAASLRDNYEHRFGLPSEIVGRIKASVWSRLDGAPLWLHLDEVDVSLPLVPWEGLLQPLGVPLLRVPYYAVPPVVLPGTIDSPALCKSSVEPTRSVKRMVTVPAGATIAHRF